MDECAAATPPGVQKGYQPMPSKCTKVPVKAIASEATGTEAKLAQNSLWYVEQLTSKKKTGTRMIATCILMRLFANNPSATNNGGLEVLGSDMI